MSAARRTLLVTLVILAGLLLPGCGTPDINPPYPRAGTGYVDFYTDSDLGLSWEVKRVDSRTGKLKKVFSEFYPVAGNVLRLGAPPGRQQYQIWFISIATEGPQSVKVDVDEGKVTPVHVTFRAVGKTLVDRDVWTIRSSARAYGRRRKVVLDVDRIYRIEAAAGEPQRYLPKEQMPYGLPLPK